MNAWILALWLAASPAQSTEIVELNTASMEQLMTLPGVGQTRADAILKYRAKHGFRRPADLLRIRGIGQKTFGKMKARVKVEVAQVSKNMATVK
jgi:competence protein ComEA